MKRKPRRAPRGDQLRSKTMKAKAKKISRETIDCSRSLPAVWRLAGPAAMVMACLALAFCVSASAQVGGGRGKIVRRATPPSPKWDKGSTGTFYEDALATLAGPRPDFSAASAAAATSTAKGAAEAATVATGGPAASGGSGGFKWSTLVSEETLTDEVKDQKASLGDTVASPSDFKGGGYDKAREGFSAVALVFGVIAAYDQDVRWKKDAETARDVFARVGFNCKVGTDQSFSESKARVADLEKLLEGSSIEAKADRDEDFRWNQVAGRPPLMSRLEAAENAIGGAVASKGDFDKQVERLLHEVEMVAVIGEVIQQPEFEYHDDDTYRGYASGMRDAAVKARDAAKKGDYDGVRGAVGELKKSCEACHGDYRS
jgi:hypothetical protein